MNSQNSNSKYANPFFILHFIRIKEEFCKETSFNPSTEYPVICMEIQKEIVEREKEIVIKENTKDVPENMAVFSGGKEEGVYVEENVYERDTIWLLVGNSESGEYRWYNNTQVNFVKIG